MTAMDPDIQNMLRRYREREIDLHQLRVWTHTFAAVNG